VDRQRNSSIAHGALPVWNPVSVGRLEEYVQRLSLPAGAAVLDIGCGRGFLLGRILARYDVSAIGIDVSPFAIAAAETDLAGRVGQRRLSLIEGAFQSCDYPAASFDLVICLGATHAVGGYRQTLREARRILRNGGMLLVGEGYWKRTPPAEYLAFLQTTADQQSTHDGAQSIGLSEGFELAACSECTLQEWDAYEGQYAANVEDYARANPHDPDAEPMLQRIRAWRDAYLRWGRDTLGFGLYLFRIGA
jgi:cyclopropane fatty-acyl-phospholipid synthase-like methyltransferase